MKTDAPKTPFWTTVSPHGAFSTPLAPSEWERMFPIMLYGAMVEAEALLQKGVDSLGYIWVRSMQQDCELLATRKDLSPYPFNINGDYFQTIPYLWALFSYAEVVEGYASQDQTVYRNEPTNAFIMPADSPLDIS